MKALSIRAPWWWFILHGGKDVENRGWRCWHRGPLLIHASSWWRHDEVLADLATAMEIVGPAGFGRLPDESLVDLRARGGHVVGRVTMTTCTLGHPSPWFFGRFGFVLAEPVAFARPFPWKGRLGLFDVSDKMFYHE